MFTGSALGARRVAGQAEWAEQAECATASPVVLLSTHRPAGPRNKATGVPISSDGSRSAEARHAPPALHIRPARSTSAPAARKPLIPEPPSVSRKV